jgi:hypothetical protein
VFAPDPSLGLSYLKVCLARVIPISFLIHKARALCLRLLSSKRKLRGINRGIEPAFVALVLAIGLSALTFDD